LTKAGRSAGKNPLLFFTYVTLGIYILGFAGWMEHSYSRVQPRRTTERLADPQETSTHTMMVSGKGDFAGTDLFTPDIFDEIWPLHLHFLELSVETSNGNVFSGRDLCSKGSVPSTPELEHATPCMIVSPFQCFSEYTEALQPLYREHDLQSLPQIDANNMTTFTPYHNRPSFRTSNASEMKTEASILRGTGSRGCQWWTSTVTLPAEIWGGSSITWNEGRTLIEHVPTLSVNFVVEHPSKLSWLGNIADVSEAISLHALQWQKDVQEFSERSKLMEVVSADPTTYDAVSDELFAMDWKLIAVALAAIFVFTVAALWDPINLLESRSQLGFRSLVLVLIGTMSNLHPYFSPFVGMIRVFVTMAPTGPWLQRDPVVEGHLVESTLIINVVMCFAIMDLFVWIHHFSKLGVRYIEQSDFDQIVEKVFVSAGRTVLLSMTLRFFFAELVMFNMAYGTIQEVGFRVRSMMFANAVLQFGQFPYLMVCEARRIKAGVRHHSFPFEPSTSSFTVLTRPSTKSKKFEQFSGMLMRLEVKLTLTALSLAFAYGCFFVMEPKGTGYDLSVLASTENSDRHRTLGMFDNQGTFPVTLVFFNMSAETDGQTMLNVYNDVTNTPRTRPDIFPTNFKNRTWSPPWSSMTRTVYHDPFLVAGAPWELFAHSSYGIPGICSGDGDPAASFEYYNRWPALLRQGYAQATATGLISEGGVIEIDHISENGRTSHVWNKTGHTSDESIETGASIVPVFKDEVFPKDQHVFYQRFYMAEAAEDKEIMRAVRGVQEVLKNSNLNFDGMSKVYACGPTYTQYEGLQQVEWSMIQSGKFFVAFTFIVSWILLGFRLAAAHTLSSTMMLMEFWGIVLYNVKLNVFSVAAMLMAGSLAPVFTANIAVAFKGNPEIPPGQRLALAMGVALPVTLKGSLAMLVILLPLLWSPSPLIVQYFAVPSITIVLLGVLHGCVISPAFLALVAQNEVTSVEAFEESECVGVAIEVSALQGRPNLLESAAVGQLEKSK